MFESAMAVKKMLIVLRVTVSLGMLSEPVKSLLKPQYKFKEHNIRKIYCYNKITPKKLVILKFF